jgi:hypothetical protein
MDVTEFKRLLDERDAELNVNEDNYYYGGAIPALDHLYNGKPVKLFNGSIVIKIETLDNFKADYDGHSAGSGWDYSYAEGESFVVQVDADANGEFFKITGYYDSWDNGRPDIFKETDIVKVEKVPVDKYEWKEVK